MPLKAGILCSVQNTVTAVSLPSALVTIFRDLRITSRVSFLADRLSPTFTKFSRPRVGNFISDHLLAEPLPLLQLELPLPLLLGPEDVCNNSEPVVTAASLGSRKK